MWEKNENGDREREKEMMKKIERPIYGGNEGWREMEREREIEMMKKIERPIYGDNEEWRERERERERERQLYRDKRRLGEMEREFMRCIIFIPFETEYKIEK